MDEGIPINKLTVFRIKNEYIGKELQERAAALKVINDNVSVYYEGTHRSEPIYLRRFFGINGDGQFYTASAKLIVIVKNIGVNKETLAFTFGSGRHLLRAEALDARFGLKVALNIINSDEVKTFNKTVLESNPKNAKEQLAKTANATEFGVSSEQDLIKGITGKIKPSWATKLGKNVSGSESLSISVHCTIDDISGVAKNIIEAYESEEYKQNFDWVDQICCVKDKEAIRELNGLLIAKFASHENGGLSCDKIWAAAPDYIDYEDIYSFRFGDSKKAKSYDDIERLYIIEALGDNITLDSLKRLKICAVSGDDEIIRKWSAFRCIYAEITLDDRVYLLMDGKWYEIAKDFCEEIKKSYDSISKRSDYIAYRHKQEADYNKELASNIGGTCYDRKEVVYGSSHSKIEVCDVQTNEGDLIHVKKYTGSSALSHLFNQGYVSAELINNDENFLKKAKEKIGGDFGKKPKGRKRKIIFAIITSKKDKFDIPFFSKVTLRNINRQLKGMGFDVELQLIQNTNEGAGEE